MVILEDSKVTRKIFGIIGQNEWNNTDIFLGVIQKTSKQKWEGEKVNLFILGDETLRLLNKFVWLFIKANLQ